MNATIKPLSPAQRRALVRAAEREHGHLCPMSVHAAAQTVLLRSLDRLGLIDWNDGAPTINDAGRAAIAPAASGYTSENDWLLQMQSGR